MLASMLLNQESVREPEKNSGGRESIHMIVITTTTIAEVLKNNNKKPTDLSQMPCFYSN